MTDTAPAAPVVNGETYSSQFLTHLASYPIVSGSISTIKNNPYGQKSIELAEHGTGYAKPFLPYLSKPYGYLAPYISKADSLGNDGLTRVEAYFPIVKKDLDGIKDVVKGYVTLPLHIAEDGKQYVLNTYGAEYKKIGGEGYVASGKALVATGLLVTSHTLSLVSNYLGHLKEEQEKKAPQ